MRIPNEVLQAILKNLVPPTGDIDNGHLGLEPRRRDVKPGEQALARLAVTCKQLHQAVPPVIYRGISSGWAQRTQDKQYPSAKRKRHTKRLSFLLRTFIENSSLADHARHIRLNYLDYDGSPKTSTFLTASLKENKDAVSRLL